MVIEKNLIEKVDNLIRLRATGSPLEFAEILEISERQIYRLINFMKDLSCPIVYDKYQRTYKYEMESCLEFRFRPSVNHNENTGIIEKNDLNNIKGGFFETFFHSDKIWHYDKIILGIQQVSGKLYLIAKE